MKQSADTIEDIEYVINSITKKSIKLIDGNYIILVKLLKIMDGI